jgi:hypothetical protein
MDLDAATVSVIVAAVTVTLDRAIALVKVARERAAGGTSCEVSHERMCTVLERLVEVQEKEIDILHEQGTVLEVVKLMVGEQREMRPRSYSPNTVALLQELDRRREVLDSARSQMSDPPPRDRSKGGNR